MTCKCGSDRIIKVCGKTSDLCSVTYDNQKHHGYVPTEIGLGSDSDYIDISYCADCGTIQGNLFPLPQNIRLNDESEEEDEEEDEEEVDDFDWENIDYDGGRRI